MAHARIHGFISGQVQGVAYRVHTQREATQLGLTGWVRNCPDGRVELVAEGEQETLQQLILWCHQGPPAAQVTDVAAQWEAATGTYRTFEIRR
ncbi:MAG: acylphosphatase [Candidatus Entotheonella factor]|uniref:acylphosphatase n=1 Tax=Entotheonella factor TaxID=1429438 RepID=W4LDP6_ENTF1|nr:acylphosphatase [Candidatus Entotheonella palauensis]ETW96122.1 MAG: acylphosphatase [Candidatus Entotheonella factor]